MQCWENTIQRIYSFWQTKPDWPLSTCILLTSWLMSWARSPSLGPGGMLGDRPSRAWFMDRPLWWIAAERHYKEVVRPRNGPQSVCSWSVVFVYSCCTYVSCLRSFLCGRGSWTHCCCGEMMGDCRASCCLPRTGQERDCPARVPGTPTTTHSIMNMKRSTTHSASTVFTNVPL